MATVVGVLVRHVCRGLVCVENPVARRTKASLVPVKSPDAAVIAPVKVIGEPPNVNAPPTVPEIVGEVRVLLVRVWLSVVPTIVPTGAATVLKTLLVVTRTPSVKVVCPVPPVRRRRCSGLPSEYAPRRRSG